VTLTRLHCDKFFRQCDAWPAWNVRVYLTCSVTDTLSPIMATFIIRSPR